MYLQFHSLLAGSMLLAACLLLQLPSAMAAVVVPICLLVESGKLVDRFQGGGFWSYLLVALLQSLAMLAAYAGVRHAILGSI